MFLILNQLKSYNDLFIILIIIISVVLVKAAQLKHKKAYYVYNEGLLEWQAAEEFCVQKGMHLVSIESMDESNFLKNFIQLKYQKMPPYWTGGYKLNNTWHWIGTGDKIKDFIWHAGEPNDLYNNEGCIHTWVNEFDWNDDRCNEELPFICDLEIL